MTSSSAFSSPNRYSSGPVTSVIGDVADQSRVGHLGACPFSAAISWPNDAFTAMKAPTAPTVRAAIARPSMTWYGLARHQRAVLERARLALGAVGHDVAITDLGSAGADRRPLAAGREPGAAPAPQAGPIEHVEDAVGPERIELLEALPATPCEVHVE